ncbi:endothelin B receptor-like [Platysternon megacephalum]|uniref:Endothelin B receptor-like n=1 Tax=Platysternon megacephalum TaxID=55544 RepID=A0A4D9EAY7_9SAUR|nr:endothelin B receptor-like [Platysternon megacephalum]
MGPIQSPKAPAGPGGLRIGPLASPGRAAGSPVAGRGSPERWRCRSFPAMNRPWGATVSTLPSHAPELKGGASHLHTGTPTPDPRGAGAAGQRGVVTFPPSSGV